jgi:hypothetical protein
LSIGYFDLVSTMPRKHNTQKFHLVQQVKRKLSIAYVESQCW